MFYSILLFIYYLPVAWFMQNIFHQVSYLWVARYLGYRPTGLYPYPHWHEGKFYFARCSWTGECKYQGMSAEDKHCPIWYAPFSWAKISILVWVFFILIAIANNLNTVIMDSFLVCAIVDATWWIRGLYYGSNDCDAKRWLNGIQK